MSVSLQNITQIQNLRLDLLEVVDIFILYKQYLHLCTSHSIEYTDFLNFLKYDYQF